MATASPFVLNTPERWTASFDPEMDDDTVQRLVGMAPFSEMDPASFPRRIPLRGILRHDLRLRRYKAGEIVVRAGDHGTSAFMVVSGSAKVVIDPGLPASVLGRREPVRKSFIRILAQIWEGNKPQESFKASELQQDSRVGASRGEGDQVKVFLQDVPKVLDEHKTATITSGEFFGEIAALSRTPRTATIFAESNGTELLEIRWQGLRDLMRYNEKLQHHIDQIYRERALASHLREIPIFKGLSAEALQKVIDRTEFGTYGDYEWSGEYKRLAQAGHVGQVEKERIIAQEGDYPNGVVLIRAGFARLSRKFGNGNRTLNYLGAGRHYGLEEIVSNWQNPGTSVPLQYTLRSIGYTHVLVIPTSVMESIVLPTVNKALLPPPVVIHEEEEGMETVERSVDAAAKIGADTLEFLTENRYFNGTASMVIDLDRCTRCDDCVRACAAGHDNNPRFLRHGLTDGKIMVANACMHCSDPVCMIGCPTGAIHRDAFGGQVVINPSTCIGCKTCANNCPYDAIRMVEIRDENGDLMTSKDLKPVLKATKCDLCVEQIGGPSCERACPHGALRRINLNDLDAFASWLKR